MANDTHLREGIVVGKKCENEARVTVLDISSREDCKNCHHHPKKKSGGNSLQITARDPLDVSVGDKVQLELTPRSFGKISAVVFGVPAGSLLVGLGLGTLFSNIFLEGNYAHALQGGLAGFLFLISLGFLVTYDRYLAGQNRDTAVIKEVLKSPYRESF